MLILNLPAPEVIEVFDFESIKQRKLQRVISLMKAKGLEYIPSESDDLMTMIEADAYEDMLRATRINNAVKGQLLVFAKKYDLDHLGITRYGVQRLEGARPYASFTFSLSTALSEDITLSKDLQFGDNKGNIALLFENITIVSGELSGVGTVVLQDYVESSELKTENILTPLPYLMTAKQDENFHAGADAEDDERYRERIWLSRERKSTAGSDMTYEFYTKSADARIEDVKIIHDTAGVVKIYLLSNEGEADAVMVERVEAALNKKEIRPLTDNLQITSATIIEKVITVDIVLYDMTYEVEVRELIKKRFAENTMVFSKSLSMAKLYGFVESDQVKDATFTTPTDSINIAENEVIKITDLTLNISGVA